MKVITLIANESPLYFIKEQPKVILNMRKKMFVYEVCCVFTFFPYRHLAFFVKGVTSTIYVWLILMGFSIVGEILVTFYNSEFKKFFGSLPDSSQQERKRRQKLFKMSCMSKLAKTNDSFKITNRQQQLAQNLVIHFTTKLLLAQKELTTFMEYWCLCLIYYLDWPLSSFVINCHCR